jgi:hypothetical protein
VCVGGGAFKFKEAKNHGVLSEMTEAFGSKGCGKKDNATTIMVRLNQEPTTSPPSSIGSLL